MTTPFAVTTSLEEVIIEHDTIFKGPLVLLAILATLIHNFTSSLDHARNELDTFRFRLVGDGVKMSLVEATGSTYSDRPLDML